MRTKRNDFLIKVPWIFRAGDRKSVNERHVRKPWIYCEYSTAGFHFCYKLYLVRGVQRFIKKNHYNSHQVYAVNVMFSEVFTVKFLSLVLIAQT